MCVVVFQVCCMCVVFHVCVCCMEICPNRSYVILVVYLYTFVFSFCISIIFLYVSVLHLYLFLHHFLFSKWTFYVLVFFLTIFDTILLYVRGIE